MTDQGYHRESQRWGLRIPWWIFLLLLLSASAVATYFMWFKLPAKNSLHGVLVDLELHPSDLPRHTELIRALTTRLTAEEDILRGLAISIDSVHFSEFTSAYLAAREPDFIVLSPQSTPWYRYSGESAIHLESLKNLLQELIVKHNIPVLGICGGHQFMALTFGSTVGFMDPRFQGTFPDKYPSEALSERGFTRLETLKPDPIFENVATCPGGFTVVESHYEEVKQVPAPFVNLAQSELSRVQLIRMPGKTVYGMAFHPERGWHAANGSQQFSTSGRRMLANFFHMVSRHEGRAYAVPGSASSIDR